MREKEKDTKRKRTKNCVLEASDLSRYVSVPYAPPFCTQRGSRFPIHVHSSRLNFLLFSALIIEHVSKVYSRTRTPGTALDTE